MTTTQAAAEVFKLRVREALTAAVEQFREQAGVAPSAITIEMVETTERQDVLRRFVVGEVRIRFDL